MCRTETTCHRDGSDRHPKWANLTGDHAMELLADGSVNLASVATPVPLQYLTTSESALYCTVSKLVLCAHFLVGTIQFNSTSVGTEICKKQSAEGEALAIIENSMRPITPSCL